MGRRVETNKKGDSGTIFVRINLQNYQELEGVMGDSFFFFFPPAK